MSSLRLAMKLSISDIPQPAKPSEDVPVEKKEKEKEKKTALKRKRAESDVDTDGNSSIKNSKAKIITTCKIHRRCKSLFFILTRFLINFQLFLTISSKKEDYSIKIACLE